MCKMGLLHSVQVRGRLAVLNRNGRTAPEELEKECVAWTAGVFPPVCGYGGIERDEMRFRN